MNHFTTRYKAITSLPGNVEISHDSSNHWICYYQKGQISKGLVGVTLIDNYLEQYVFLIKDGEYLTKPEGKQNLEITNLVGTDQIRIYCYSTVTDSLQLPDFAIDVLQTVNTNLTFEVIRRIAEAFHAKLASNRQPTFKAHRFIDHHSYD
jgi:hypothetical protein